MIYVINKLTMLQETYANDMNLENLRSSPVNYMIFEKKFYLTIIEFIKLTWTWCTCTKVRIRNIFIIYGMELLEGMRDY